MRGLFALLLVLVPIAGGCGGGDDDASPASDQMCRAHVGLGVHIASIGDLKGNAYTGEPAQVETRLAAIDNSIAAARTVVPKDIAADFEATVAPYAVLHDVFEKAGYVFANLAPEDFATLSDAYSKSSDALDRYTAYLDDACPVKGACGATIKTVSVAIEAYQAQQGKLPPDAKSLVDAGFLREVPTEVQVVDGVYTMAPDADCF